MVKTYMTVPRTGMSERLTYGIPIRLDSETAKERLTEGRVIPWSFSKWGTPEEYLASLK